MTTVPHPFAKFAERARRPGRRLLDAPGMAEYAEGLKLASAPAWGSPRLVALGERERAAREVA